MNISGDVKERMAELEVVCAKKTLGQNFLVSDATLSQRLSTK